MSILELRNVEKIYGEKDNQVKALRNINLKVEEARVCCHCRHYLVQANLLVLI